MQKIKNFLLIILTTAGGASASSSHALQEYDSVGIFATVEPGEAEALFQNLPTIQAADYLKRNQKPNSIYFLDRQDRSRAHITLDTFTANDAHAPAPATAAKCTQEHAEVLKNITEFFSSNAQELNTNRSNGHHAYAASPYRLFLFTHTRREDNTTLNLHFDKENIDQVKDLANVRYANIVVRIGTKGQLRDDWRWMREVVLSSPEVTSTLNRRRVLKGDGTEMEMCTHLTLATLFKYDARKYEYTEFYGPAPGRNALQGQIVDKSDHGKKALSIAFGKSELRHIVKAFKIINAAFEKNQVAKNNKMTIDGLSISGRTKGIRGHHQHHYIHDIKFADHHPQELIAE